MKLSRTFIALIFVAIALFVATYYSSQIAQQIRNDEEIKHAEEIKKQTELTKEITFSMSDSSEDDRNFADYTAAGLFILAIATTVAAIRIKKFDD